MTVPQHDVRWLKAQRSQNEGACIELGHTGAVRDSKNPAGPTLPVELGNLLAAAKAGHLDR